jgi:hypothetical protein
MIDDAFHRRRTDRLEQYMTSDYRVVDATRPERAGGLDGQRAHIEGVLEGFEELRYDVVDAFEAGDRLAVRYVISARDREGRRVAASGVSLHHGADGLLRRSWHLGDQRDLGLAADGEPDAALVDRWCARADGGGGGVLAQRYRLAVDRLWGVPRAMGELVHPDYLVHDPFAPRPGGRTGLDDFHAALRAEYEEPSYQVLDSVEVRDRLATRFVLRGTYRGEPATILGLSINHFQEGRFHKAWIYCRYGRLAEVARTCPAVAP